MVKSYQRYEQAYCMGVIASHSNSIYLPTSGSHSKKSAGQVITAGLEEILIWDIKTGELVKRLRDGVNPGALDSSSQAAPAQVVRLEHEPNSNIVAAGYSDGSIKIWDITSSSVVISFTGHKSAISMLKFDRSGTRLASGSKDTEIIIWDLVGEVGLFKLKGHRDQITGLSYLSEPENTNIDEMEDWLLTTSKDGLIKLWDLKSQQCVETHVAHTGECWSLGLNTSNDLCITSGMENQLKVWSVDLTQEDYKIKERGSYDKQSKSRGLDIAYKVTNQGEFFFVSNADRTVELFRLRTEKEISKATTKRENRLRDKGMTEEEIQASIQESQVQMLIAPFTTIYSDKCKIRSATWAITNNRKLDMVLTLTNNSVAYYHIPIPEQAKKHNTSEKIAEEKYSLDHLGHRQDIRAVDISSDDKLLITGSNNQLKVWNLKTRSCIRTFDKVGHVLTAKFLPGGALVVLGTKEGTLSLVDLASSSIVHSIDDAHDSKAIWSIEITPDGKGILTGSADKTVKFWSIKVEQELVPGTANKYVNNLTLDHTKTLDLNDDVLSVKVSPDTKFLAVSLLDNTVKVFFFDTLKFFLSLYGHKLPVLSIDISFDSKMIITSSADKNIRIWGLDFGDCHKSIFGHQDSIMCLKFIPNSKDFFSCSKDGMVKYWDGIKFENIQKLSAHQSEVWSLAVSSTGEFFVSVSHDHSIRIWEETDDQVFLEEEREKEMDQLYEKELLESLEGDDITKRTDGDGEGEEGDEVARVSKQTMETLKSGEKLMEALDLASKDLEEKDQYQKDMKAFKLRRIATQPVEPSRNPMLQALNVEPEVYVLDILLKIKSTQLEDALIVLPFSYTLKLLKFIRIWTTPENITKNLSHISLICRALFFVIRTNSMELISQKDESIKTEMAELKDQLRVVLKKSFNDVGFNVGGLKFLKTQWSLNHAHEFRDSDTEEASDPNEKSRKRVYTTLA
ncbi:hypothetical protein CANARDRAFT_203372 [[Candida] arabinofermentans NRRL YB-2248]|uniref:Small-subunit processome Utp12 domain-containing protein n=1 Tax=[Candida] arabinofermentans NRRL YB-2248 TaxID=983967 RepID=A0A1E4SV16_9ASCO|nr:hypothetical protein CANARDRAFT_203372 [[Candida] arabinofermentans NRRL YB-2248]